jgi:hypothetical protein
MSEGKRWQVPFILPAELREPGRAPFVPFPVREKNLLIKYIKEEEDNDADT